MTSTEPAILQVVKSLSQLQERYLFLLRGILFRSQLRQLLFLVPNPFINLPVVHFELLLSGTFFFGCDSSPPKFQRELLWCWCFHVFIFLSLSVISYKLDAESEWPIWSTGPKEDYKVISIIREAKHARLLLNISKYLGSWRHVWIQVLHNRIWLATEIECNQSHHLQLLQGAAASTGIFRGQTLNPFRISASVHINILEFFPIGSMGMVYLPTWMVDFYGKCR